MCPIGVECHNLDGHSFVRSKSQTQLLSESCIAKCPAHVAGHSLEGHGFHSSLPILSSVRSRSKNHLLSKICVAVHPKFLQRPSFTPLSADEKLSASDQQVGKGILGRIMCHGKDLMSSFVWLCVIIRLCSWLLSCMSVHACVFVCTSVQYALKTQVVSTLSPKVHPSNLSLILALSGILTGYQVHDHDWLQSNFDWI